MENTLEQIIQGLYVDGFQNPIQLDRVIMDDCYEAAETSVGFYNLEPGNISHYKEVSHIAHWMSRLKSYRLQNPFNFLKTAKSFGQDIKEHLSGLKSRVSCP